METFTKQFFCLGQKHMLGQQSQSRFFTKRKNIKLDTISATVVTSNKRIAEVAHFDKNELSLYTKLWSTIN